MDTMTLVACGIYRSPHAVYQDNRDRFPVSVTSLYNKLQGIEPAVSAELVRYTASRVGDVIRALGGALPPLLAGYPVKILDGNALAGTDHRIKETREPEAAPLPGKSLVVLDPPLMLAIDVFPCEDGHAQERSLLRRYWRPSRPESCGSRTATSARSDSSSDRAEGGFVLVREHKGLPWQAISELRYGRTETGQVFEQTQVEDEAGDILFARAWSSSWTSRRGTARRKSLC